MDTITKQQIKQKIGKKTWYGPELILENTVEYIGGIELFDGFLDGRTAKEINAIIHIEKYPKGILIKIKRGIGRSNDLLFGLAKNEVKNTILSDSFAHPSKIEFHLYNGEKIVFHYKSLAHSEINDFLYKSGFINEKPIKISRGETFIDAVTDYDSWKEILGFILLLVGIGVGIYSFIKSDGTLIIAWIGAIGLGLGLLFGKQKK
jgi:small-conductance mechanosensitive channel